MKKLIDPVDVLINVGILEEQKGNGLIRKLEEAIKNLKEHKPNETAACNKLHDFIDQVDSHMNSGKLLLEDGQPLIDAANEITADVCGYMSADRRNTEWLTDPRGSYSL